VPHQARGNGEHDPKNNTGPISFLEDRQDLMPAIAALQDVLRGG